MQEVRRLALAAAAPDAEREFRLGWSVWRRAHQAAARRCHRARRAVGHAIDRVGKNEPRPLPTADAASVLGERSARLSEEEWSRLEPLFPKNGHQGRQWRDHCLMLEAVLWVLLSGASWRDLPEEEFGPWQTAYYRYARWRKEGLWQQIVAVLQRK